MQLFHRVQASSNVPLSGARPRDLEAYRPDSWKRTIGWMRNGKREAERTNSTRQDRRFRDSFQAYTMFFRLKILFGYPKITEAASGYAARSFR